MLLGLIHLLTERVSNVAQLEAVEGVWYGMKCRELYLEGCRVVLEGHLKTLRELLGLLRESGDEGGG